RLAAQRRRLFAEQLVLRLSAPLEAEPQCQLHAALERGSGISSERWVHLLEISHEIKLEVSLCIHPGEVGVIKHVVDIGAELQLEALARQTDILEQRHVPVVDARPAEVAAGGIAGSALRCAR